MLMECVSEVNKCHSGLQCVTEQNPESWQHFMSALSAHYKTKHINMSSSFPFQHQRDCGTSFKSVSKSWQCFVSSTSFTSFTQVIDSRLNHRYISHAPTSLLCVHKSCYLDVDVFTALWLMTNGVVYGKTTAAYQMAFLWMHMHTHGLSTL